VYVFVDDSGDPGFHFERGSTRLLVVACLIFDDAESLNLVVQEIEAISLQLQKVNIGEFKFSKMRFGIAKGLLETVARHNFRVHAVAINKSTWHALDARANQNIYALALANAVAGIDSAGKPINLKIDGKGNRRVKIKDFSLPMPKIRKLRYVDSRSDVLIQLADVIAGCVRRAHDQTDTANSAYFDLYRTALAPKVTLKWLEQPIK